MKIKNIILSALVVLGLTSFGGVANAACGKLVIAEQNWASAELMANVDKIILEKGYGCEVELIPGATMPTFTSMDEKGAPDMNPEQWANAVYTPLKKAVSETLFSMAIFSSNSSDSHWSKGITQAGLPLNNSEVNASIWKSWMIEFDIKVELYYK